MAIYIEPTPKITEFLKYSENSQSKHKKTTSGSGFEEILRKEQERIEKGKQDLGQIGSDSNNRDSGRDAIAELLERKGRDRYLHSTKPD